MPKNSYELAEGLARKYRRLERTRTRLQIINDSGNITNQDLGVAYEGLFLASYAYFERFIEDLFIGLLVNNAGYISARAYIVPKITVRSHKSARDILIGDRPQKYLDWIPYQITTDRALRYFASGKPFTEITDQSKEIISRTNRIRNAIAHKSQHAMQQFNRKVIGSRVNPRSQRNPVGYLQGRFRRFPNQSRYENLIANLLLIARDLAK